MLLRLTFIWVDDGYKEGVGEWVKQTFGWTFQIECRFWYGIKGVPDPKDGVIDWDKIKPKGFHVLPHRWVVERTFS